MFGDPLLCQTKRLSTPGAGYVTQLPRIIAYAPLGVKWQVLASQPRGMTSTTSNDLSESASQVGLVQCDWPEGISDGTPILPQDLFVFPDGSQHVIRMAEHWPGFHIDIYLDVLTDFPVTCSTLRQPSALNVNQTAPIATYLPQLVLRSPVEGGSPIVSVSSMFAADTFGVQVTQPGLVRADWPVGNTDDLPVTPNDILVMPSGRQYVVTGVENHHGLYLRLLIEMAVD